MAGGGGSQQTTRQEIDPMLAPYVEYVLELDVRSVVPAPTQP